MYYSSWFSPQKTAPKSPQKFHFSDTYSLMYLLILFLVLLSLHEILALSDINFVKTISDYFKSISEVISPPNFEELPDSPKATAKDPEPVLEKEKSLESAKPSASDGVLAKLQSLPPLKVTAELENLRVAIIENVDTPSPQALVLKVRK